MATGLTSRADRCRGGAGRPSRRDRAGAARCRSGARAPPPGSGRRSQRARPRAGRTLRGRPWERCGARRMGWGAVRSGVRCTVTQHGVDACAVALSGRAPGTAPRLLQPRRPPRSQSSQAAPRPQASCVSHDGPRWLRALLRCGGGGRALEPDAAAASRSKGRGPSEEVAPARKRFAHYYKRTPGALINPRLST